MVPAKFGSNKREGNELWAREGDFGVAREKKRGVPECYGNLKINPVVLKESNKKDLFR